VADKKVVILIPFWVQETLKRNNLQLSACLELEKIKPLFSTNDLITFLTLQDQRYLKLVAGLDTVDQLTWVWSNSILKSNRELNDILWKTLVPASSDPSFHTEITERLFTEESKDKRHSDPFVTFDLTPDVCGVVLYPGYFISPNNIDLQKAVIEAIIEVLYRYLSFHETAQSPFFKRYLETLSDSKRN
jgi:hypothetical protein